MNFPDQLLPSSWLWGGGLAALLLLALVVRKAPWSRLIRHDLLNVWLGACVGLMLVWSIKTGVRPGLSFHLLGATLLTLMFGPHLALVGLAVVLLGITLAGMSGWGSFGINLLLMGALPVLASHALFRFAERRLPNHLFVYIFVPAFAGAALAIVTSGLAASLLLVLGDAYSISYLADNYLPYYILMGWAEAMLTGMAVTLMTAFRPDWLATFSDARYLKRNSGRDA